MAPGKREITLLEAGSNEVEFLEFNVAGHHFGVNVHKVLQAVSWSSMRLVRVPNAPEGYLGEVVLRGAPLSVVSLRAQLRLPVLWESDHPLLLVAEFNQRITGFLIDEMIGIHRVSWKAFTSFGQVANLGACSSVIGTITIDSRVIQVLDLEAMMSKLDTTMSLSEAGIGVETGSAFDPSSVRLVYAEDSPTIQKITLRLLQQAGFLDIRVFSTGHDAFDYITGGSGESVDVLLTDIEMPEMDGLTLCRKLREHAVFRELPIIFYSSMINEQMVLKCTAVGGSRCFAKPDLTGIIGAVEALCGRRVALERCAEIEKGVSSPTFLLGNHRSGTTWLYSLLAATGHFSTLTAHHVISWHEPMSKETLAARLQAEGLFERALDGIVLSPDTPEEYCYILNNAGHKSWLTRKSRPLLASIIDRLVVDGEGRQVLLKNPWDYAHFPALAAAWPDARFIFLHRHPLRVIQSAARVFRVMWSPPEPDGYVRLLSARYRRMWASPLTRGFFRWAATGALDLDVRAISGGVRAANQHYLRRFAALRPEQRVVVRYEDLCASPDEELRRILRFLDAPPTTAQVPAREGSSPLLPAIARHQPRICRSMKAYLDHFSYNAEGGADPWSPR